MLTQRTNLLLSPTEYNALQNLSNKHGKTVGELIRQAVRKTYNINVNQAKELDKTLHNIRQLTKKAKLDDIDHKALIKVGRKYD
jgi:hypothetical protein